MKGKCFFKKEGMILSALLTSVGINLALTLLFFALYSILRKQPENADVYAPRLIAEGRSQQQEGRDFNLERLLPSAGWLRRAWQPSEDELLSTSGLDAVVFMRIFIFRSTYFVPFPISAFAESDSDNYLKSETLPLL